MAKRSTWLKLAALSLSGGILLQGGCLADFWEGFANTGWPTNNFWINLAFDILQEELLG
jgi:hypothetical protein